MTGDAAQVASAAPDAAPRLPPGEANQDVASRTLLELAREDPAITVVTSDSRGSGKLVPFGEELPDQLVEVGIAEQNLVGIAAGLASCGLKVFAVSPACFLTARALEQIKNDVAYSGQPVRLVGISAGVSYGALGSTHHAIHDFAALRAIHGIDIVAPGDNLEAREAIRAAAASERPIYLRFGKFALPRIHPEGTRFEIGRALRVREGGSVAFVATGEALAPATEAAGLLGDAAVLSVPTIRPLDAEAVLDLARSCRAMITVEEHSVHGGLGEACASLLMQAGVAVPFRIVGLPDEDTVTGRQHEILGHYGISGSGLAETARKLLAST